MSSIDLQEKYLSLVKKILQQHLAKNTKIWLFGSRANQTAKNYSDIDLAIDQQGKPLYLSTEVTLATIFEESDLPYKVDIVDWNKITPEFKTAIDADKKLILVI